MLFANLRKVNHRFSKVKHINLLFFSNPCELAKQVFLCLGIFTQGIEVPGCTIFFSPTFKCLLIRVNNSNKERLKAVPIYPYLRLKDRQSKTSTSSLGKQNLVQTKCAISMHQSTDFTVHQVILSFVSNRKKWEKVRDMNIFLADPYVYTKRLHLFKGHKVVSRMKAFRVGWWELKRSPRHYHRLIITRPN